MGGAGRGGGSGREDSRSSGRSGLGPDEVMKGESPGVAGMPSISHACARTAPPEPLSLLASPCARQGEPESAALTRLALDSYFAAEFFHDAANDGQA